MAKPIDLSKPKWDQSTYMGRVKHFLLITNPLNCLASDEDLDMAKRVVEEYRKTKVLPHGYDEDKLWAAKYLYDSAFHPDTGEKMLRIGRMSAQAPMNAIITGSLLIQPLPATLQISSVHLANSIHPKQIEAALMSSESLYFEEG
ncbi:unnamed protein product [Spodoptera exigua]|nr:unnamed protein product [Spodoptera exigua]